jgi:hypothetical protein
MPATDHKRGLKDFYQPTAKEFSIVDLPPLQYLMVDGQGDPNTSQSYADALNALYTVSYTLKFALKKSDPDADFSVMPLEGLWWSDDETAFVDDSRDAWLWTAMIMQPPKVTAEAVAAAMRAAAAKKLLPALPGLRFAGLEEGLCAQILYVGPYKDEGPTIQRLHDFIRDRGYVLRGKHHEIYLGDPRRTDPAKLRTVIRQPMARP